MTDFGAKHRDGRDAWVLYCLIDYIFYRLLLRQMQRLFKINKVLQNFINNLRHNGDFYITLLKDFVPGIVTF